MHLALTIWSEYSFTAHSSIRRLTIVPHPAESSLEGEDYILQLKEATTQCGRNLVVQLEAPSQKPMRSRQRPAPARRTLRMNGA